MRDPGPRRRRRKVAAPRSPKGSSSRLQAPGAAGGLAWREALASCCERPVGQATRRASEEDGRRLPQPICSEVCKVLSRFVGDRQRAQRQDGTATTWGPRAYIPAAAPSLTLGKRPLGGELWGAGASSPCHAEGHPAVDRTAHSHREAQPGVLQHLFQADLSKSLSLQASLFWEAVLREEAYSASWFPGATVCRAEGRPWAEGKAVPPKTPSDHRGVACPSTEGDTLIPV